MSDNCLDTTVSNDFLNYYRSKTGEWTVSDLCRILGALYTEHRLGSLSGERAKSILEPFFEDLPLILFPLFDPIERSFEKGDTTPDEQADSVAFHLYEWLSDGDDDDEDDDEDDDGDDDDEDEE